MVYVNDFKMSVPTEHVATGFAKIGEAGLSIDAEGDAGLFLGGAGFDSLACTWGWWSGFVVDRMLDYLWVGRGFRSTIFIMVQNSSN